LQKLIQLGWSDGSQSLKEMMRRAIYRHPEWILVQGDREGGSDALVGRIVKNLKKPVLQKIKAGLEKPVREVAEMDFTLSLYWAERLRFEILHRAGEAVYRMIEAELNPRERTVFKQNFLKAPNYLDRVVQFDPSPVMYSYLLMLEKAERQAGAERAHRFINSRTIPIIWRSYLNFYPHWIDSVLMDEEEKRHRGRKEVSYGSWSVAYAKDQADYSPDAVRAVLSESDKPPEERSRKRPKKRRKKGRRRRAETISLEQNIASLAAEGMRNKDIAKKVGKSVSYVSKIRRRVQDRAVKLWERCLRDPLRRSLHGKIERIYLRLTPPQKNLFKALYVGCMRDFIEELCEYQSKSNPKTLEKDLIPRILRE